MKISISKKRNLNIFSDSKTHKTGGSHGLEWGEDEPTSRWINLAIWLTAGKTRQFDTSRVKTGQFANQSVFGEGSQTNGWLKPTVFQQTQRLAVFHSWQPAIWQRAQVALQLQSLMASFHLQRRVKDASNDTIIIKAAMSTKWGHRRAFYHG